MTTIRLMLTLSLLLGLNTQNINFTLVYTQAPIDFPTFLDLPIGFDVDCNHDEWCIELQKNHYGLK
jgi:hypothetical protein